MKDKLFNWPKYRKLEDYNEAISIVQETIKQERGLVGLYQVGSISNPGISDIDLVAVFEDGYSTSNDPLGGLDKRLRYLFTHGVFAISRSSIEDCKKFFFYFNFKKLFGNLALDDDIDSIFTEEDFRIVKIQTALEFLLINYIKKQVESAYKMIDVRSTLLSCKALFIDLDCLEIQKGLLRTKIEELIDWRRRWFTSIPKNADLINWNNEFLLNLKEVIVEILKKHPLFFPITSPLIHFGRHVCIRNAPFSNPVRKGFSYPLPLNKKYFRLFHRFNNFDFAIPWNSEAIPDIILKRFLVQNQISSYQKSHFSWYSTLVGTIGRISE